MVIQASVDILDIRDLAGLIQELQAIVVILDLVEFQVTRATLAFLDIVDFLVIRDFLELFQKYHNMRLFNQTWNG